jgi:hypothetical protein
MMHSEPFKTHSIAKLCRTNQSFLLHLWDRLLPKTLLILNLLRSSRITQDVSISSTARRLRPQPNPDSPCRYPRPRPRSAFCSWHLVPPAVDVRYLDPATNYRYLGVWINENPVERIAETLKLVFNPSRYTYRILHRSCSGRRWRTHQRSTEIRRSPLRSFQ